MRALRNAQEFAEKANFREDFQKHLPKRDLYPKPLQNLIDLLTKLPGIGPRQAGRFAFYILKNKEFTEELGILLRDFNQKIGFCSQCFRTREVRDSESSLCIFCRDSKRDVSFIAIVEKEADLLNLEKTGFYQGMYHVLGGVISPLDSDSPKRLHLKHLYERIKSVLEKNSGKCEVVLATNPTTEGDMTSLYIERILAPLKELAPNLKISRLGRGLSLGSELEYADEITLKNALTNRR